jgi:hypothetical protein
MAASTLQSLATSSGLSGLGRGLGDVSSFYQEGASALPAIRQLIKEEIESDPRLADVKVRTTPGIHGGYFPGRDTIALGVINPAVVAHELGHAKNLRRSKIYRKILMTANDVARLNNTAALPAMLAIRALVKDKDTRDEVFNILTGVSAAVAAPGLAEEVSASIDALKHAPDKLQALKTLIPAFIHHSLSAALPVGVYQLGKHI